MGNITVFPVKTVPFLALWDDVIEGSPRPKLNGYQRPIPGGACGAKGLGGFRQTPASEAFWSGDLHGTCTRSQRVKARFKHRQVRTGVSEPGVSAPVFLNPVFSALAPHDRYGLAQFPSLAIWRELPPPTRPSCARASGDPGAAKNQRIERPRTGVSQSRNGNKQIVGWPPPLTPRGTLPPSPTPCATRSWTRVRSGQSPPLSVATGRPRLPRCVSPRPSPPVPLPRFFPPLRSRHPGVGATVFSHIGAAVAVQYARPMAVPTGAAPNQILDGGIPQC